MVVFWVPWAEKWTPPLVLAAPGAPSPLSWAPAGGLGPNWPLWSNSMRGPGRSESTPTDVSAFSVFSSYFFPPKIRFRSDTQSIYKTPAVFIISVGAGSLQEAFRTRFGPKNGPFWGPFLDKFRSDLESAFWTFFGTVPGGPKDPVGWLFGPFLGQKMIKN